MKTTVPNKCNIRSKWLYAFLLLVIIRSEKAFSQASAALKFGNSYVNISKKTAGGPVQPGDTLEIRTSLYFNSTYDGTGQVYALRYFDNIPTNTDTIANDSLRLITNEGLTFRHYTEAPGDDAGSIVMVPVNPGDYQVRINMGGWPFSANPMMPGGMGLSDTVGARNLKAGTVVATCNKPMFGGGMLVCTSFRVRVTGAYGDTIVLGAGKIAYRTSPTATTDTVINCNQWKILINKPSTLCSSVVGTNFAAEAGGTFDSGAVLNRSYGPTYLIPGYTYLPNASTAVTINDGYYAIVNNTSPTSSTTPGARRAPNCNVPTAIPNTNPLSCYNREFTGFWFIGGDHTGTTTAAGNAPPAAGTKAGYMLLVNADLATSEAYRQTITGLCPNTYYQFSAWIKNVCPNCGIDSSGKSVYTPGVLPNLTFVVDSLDMYSTGQLDTVGWQQRGFVLLTGAAQTSITISLRNNAPGGGGNDWALDDITLATCPPVLALTPNKPDTICQGEDDTVRFAISSYVNNYTQWTLQQSTDGGTTWTTPGNDTTGQPATGSVVPVYNPTLGEYVDTVSRFYRLNPVNTLIEYRITVASTTANLSSANCSFTASSPKVVHAVNCNIVLPTTLISFRGQAKDGYGNLTWVSADEVAELSYIVERSDDGQNFTPIGTVNGTAPLGQGSNYQFADPTPLNANTYYRIDISTPSYHQYSHQVLLSNSALAFAIKTLVNPFVDHIPLELTVPVDGSALITLVDMYGRVIVTQHQTLSEGLNNITLYGLGGLATGAYALQVRYGDQVYSNKMLKVSAH